MSHEQDDGYLRDSEVALMDTLKLLIEAIIAKGLSKSATIDEALRQQMIQYPAETMPRAVYIVEQLRATLNDPDRKQLRELLARPSEGNA
jgi:flagellin-specific chaperone FliS